VAKAAICSYNSDTLRKDVEGGIYKRYFDGGNEAGFDIFRVLFMGEPLLLLLEV